MWFWACPPACPGAVRPGVVQAPSFPDSWVPRHSWGLVVKVVVAIDLENRCRGDADLLEACVRDGVSVFNRQVGHAASISLVRQCGDDTDMELVNRASLKRR